MPKESFGHCTPDFEIIKKNMARRPCLLWSNLHRLCLPTAIVVPVIVQELGINGGPFRDIIPQEAVGLTEFKFRFDPKKARPNARRHFDGQGVVVCLPVKLRALENVGSLNENIKFVHLRSSTGFRSSLQTLLGPIRSPT